ncbi:MAG TPA: hypothetical protein QF359_06545 [Rhodospirillales bacterium]|jgi:hypothetical protein|nr:hypothetical protein [Rhodospirillales bacterium]MDP7425648.1 hypothetical protein [Rhodospirillales bacterium]MDP7624576.1 hypothetical protein [Rhodospirillales bacterium]HJO86602.1 hypothetical protein [Rhodospirillales bacterium]|tara:strand:+ start:740 stop:973 length:234 start_codon:yes stop_codon:yes gene_type:complete
MEKFELLRRALWFLVEIFSLGLVLLIFVYFLLGQSAGEFIVGLIGNIGVFAKATGENAIIAILIIISLVLYLNNKQR